MTEDVNVRQRKRRPSVPSSCFTDLRAHSLHLLHVDDELSLLCSIASIAHQCFRYRAVAVAMKSQDGQYTVQASVGFSPEQERDLRRWSLADGTLDDWRRSSKVSGSVLYRQRSNEDGGQETTVVVPLTDVDGIDVGFLWLQHPPEQVGTKGAERVALEMYAHAASMALIALNERRADRERIRLIETQKRQLEALLEASAKVHSAMQLQEVLQSIALSMTNDGGFQRAVVYLRDLTDDLLHARAFVGVPPEDMERMQASVPFSVFAHLMRPEMQISRSFVFDHTKHEIPPDLMESLSIPKDREWEPGHWHPLDSLTIPLQDREGRTIGLISMDEPDDGRFPELGRVQALELFAGACAMAVEQARLYDEIHRLAMTDPLTSLHNRRAFEDALRRELARTHREGMPCSVLYCDLDRLKDLNDNFGHEVGDRVLKAVANLFRERLREGDLAARYGGDEFVVLLPGDTREQAEAVAEDLRRLVTGLKPPLVPKGRAPLTISVGVAGISDDDSSSQVDLLRAADQALYEAKASGRNCVRVA